MWRPEIPYTENTPLAGRMEWLFRSFRKLSLWSDEVQEALGYGGLIQRTPQAIPDIISPNYGTVPFDEGLISVPYLVHQDPANDQFRIDAAGIWFVGGYGAFTFTKDAVNDRTIYVRFYNITDGVPFSANPFPIYAESNTTGETWAFNTLFEIPESLISKNFRMELGGSAQNFTGITIDKAGLTLTAIPSRRTAITTFFLPSP